MNEKSDFVGILIRGPLQFVRKPSRAQNPVPLKPITYENII